MRVCVPNVGWRLWKTNDFGLCFNSSACRWPCVWETLKKSTAKTHDTFPALTEANETLPKNITIVVARCQEDLRWISCDWHPNVTFIVYEKCKRTRGFRRPKRGNVFFGLVRNRRMRNMPIVNLSCVTHMESQANGREAEAYLNYIVTHYKNMSKDTWHLFLQGSPFDEVHMQLRQKSMRESLMHMSPQVWFSSLSGVNMVSHETDIFASHRLPSLRIAQVQTPFVKPYHPVRAQFIVRGDIVQDVPLQTWKYLLKYVRKPEKMIQQDDALGANQYVAVDLEHAWSSLFGCWHVPTSTRYAEGPQYGRGFECHDA